MEKETRSKVVAEPGRQELFVISEYDAPRELVFRAYTDRKLFVQWLGPRDLTTKLERFEPRTGGSFRFIQKDKQGKEHAFHGVTHEVRAPERIIDTFEYEGLPEPGHVLLQTNLFEQLPDGRTRVKAQSVFQSVEDRDGMLRSGMETGVQESKERLDAILEKLKNERPAQAGR